MPIMLWDQSLDIGVEPMNHEHRDILNAMNQIYDLGQKGVQGASVTRLVDRLGEICVHHFADEERFMESIGYPALAVHKDLHRRLLEKYHEHAAAIRAADGVAGDDFFQFLRFWLASHIKGVDVKYAAHARGARPAA